MVLYGKVVFTCTDGTQDAIAAGEAYVTKAGHKPKIYPGIEVIEFTETDEQNRTMVVSADGGRLVLVSGSGQLRRGRSGYDCPRKGAPCASSS